ncbi:hypothetical protein I4I73_16710 [Pseudonocardia sp. KRD-184]|uniref:Uncharacterized protein n=1 Tax=Pseudonocardia oceani TaxID=2792013 RepID=A0ABS6UE81_9PSEU|nr:hypothetical protein [Pseudonocardia oceani]MBW0092329.1 hypothetical protein [Pseudonocardia oceani]MBW0097624.1 hypothetical protein [Pseudonocardia oceani]MBW0107663.1 hypothetical protein [Pseudonocardia oceani]MBW0123162.1 hypothetical protein [Pseudonocardia oceani]MBW0130530.1 hypothetical protein [Pseudonocardia oceani]
MAPDSPDWTVPAPLRALLWWPGVSFVLVLVAPQAAVGSIVVAGLALMVVGLLAGRLTRAASEGGMVTSDRSELEPAA